MSDTDTASVQPLMKAAFPQDPIPHGLSARELEVLRRIGEGLTVSEVAKCLGLSVKTVSTYRERVLTKLLEARLITHGTTTGLIRYALTSGLVQ